MIWLFIILTEIYKTKSINHSAATSLTKMLMQHEKNELSWDIEVHKKINYYALIQGKNGKETWWKRQSADPSSVGCP